MEAPLSAADIVAFPTSLPSAFFRLTVTGFAFVSWYGLWGPRNLKTDVSSRLQSEIAKLLAFPEVKQRLNQLGFEPIGAASDQFASYIREEMAKAEKIIADAKIRVD